MQASVNRRHFLAQFGLLATQRSICMSAALSLSLVSPLSGAQSHSHQHDPVALSTLQPDEAAGLEAIAARILPEDESGPGAISGGVIAFMDRELGASRAEWLDLLREGLQELEAQARSQYGSNFAALESTQQDALLRSIESSSFFGTVRTLTMAGMFALPQYGGNRDHAGYALIGFGHQHAWQPPFGHYDANYMTMARGE
jgi:gluconate 2-dehydrogenase gamma chain